jgi:hypothetical protein
LLYYYYYYYYYYYWSRDSSVVKRWATGWMIIHLQECVELYFHYPNTPSWLGA